jgi:cellulose synthase/poly-beta-1,6-N-acetylglucosamine synthase-like glycosyltransferase
VLTAVAGLSAVCLFLVWLGYPAAIATLAAVARVRRRPGVVNEPSVSVILATRENVRAVLDRVDDLFATSYPRDRIEVIVALDSGDTAAARDAFNHMDRVRVVAGDSPGGKAAALNAGARAATSDILVFADTFQRFESDAISRLVAALDDARYGAVSGRLELPAASAASPVGMYWRLERRLRSNEARLHSTIGVTGAIYAMRRQLWMPLPPGLILDDVYTPMRLILAGHRIGFADAARATEMRGSSASGEFRRKVRTLTGVLQLCAWMPALLVPIRNPVWIQFVFHKLLRLATPYLILPIAVWVVVRSTQALVDSPSAALIAGVVVALSAVLAGRRLGAIAWRGLVWGVSLQAAVVVATAQGLRGRWDVWRS